MLAIMMLFGALSISASASNNDILQLWRDPSTVVIINNEQISKADHVVLSLNFNGGSSFTEVASYDPNAGSFVWGVASDTYLMLPGAAGNYLRPGEPVTLPRVTAPDGKQFTGWYCEETGEYVVGGKTWVIPEGTGGTIYHFTAEMLPSEAEADTMATVMGILIKIFGTIIGILFLDGSAAAGIELMEKMLGGLLG